MSRQDTCPAFGPDRAAARFPRLITKKPNLQKDEFSFTTQAGFTSGGVYTQPLTTSVDGFVSADYSYTGNSVSLLNGGAGAESTRPDYSLANLRFGADYKQSEFSLNIHNLTNAKPNLGDIGYVGYAQYDAAGSVIPQVATLQPLTVMLQYKQGF